MALNMLRTLIVCMLHVFSEWGRLSWNGIPVEPEMEVIDVDSESEPLCQDERPEEVFSVDWRPASEMIWQLEDRKSALLEYLTEYGPHEFPPFKKRLKKLKRMLTKLGNGEQSNDSSADDCSAKAKLSNFHALFADVVNHVTVATVRLNQPGLHKFFVEGIGKDVLPSLERRHSCSVEAVCETPPVVPSVGVQSSALPDLEEVLDTLSPQVKVSGLIERNMHCHGFLASFSAAKIKYHKIPILSPPKNKPFPPPPQISDANILPNISL